MEQPKILQHHINKTGTEKSQFFNKTGTEKRSGFFCFCFLHKKILKHKKSDFDFDKSLNTSMVWNIDFLFFFFFIL